MILYEYIDHLIDLKQHKSPYTCMIILPNSRVTIIMSMITTILASYCFPLSCNWDIKNIRRKLRQLQKLNVEVKYFLSFVLVSNTKVAVFIHEQLLDTIDKAEHWNSFFKKKRPKILRFCKKCGIAPEGLGNWGS